METFYFPLYDEQGFDLYSFVVMSSFGTRMLRFAMLHIEHIDNLAEYYAIPVPP